MAKRPRDDNLLRRAQATPDEFAEAMLKDAQMEETAAYLQRGHLHRDVPTEQLDRLWTDAFTRWLLSCSADSQQKMDDLTAELRLRGREPPSDAVRQELDALRAERMAGGPLDEAIQEKVGEFLKSLAKPRN